MRHYNTFEKLERIFDRRRRKGYHFQAPYDKKNVRRIARMCQRIYQEAITSAHASRRIDRKFGEIEEDDSGRTGRRYFATDIKNEVIGKIIWVSEKKSS